jgi:hypothetical protein
VAHRACPIHQTKQRRLKRVTLCLALLTLFIPTQAQAAREWKCPQWHTMLRKHGLPVEVFDHIMWRESKCEPKAVGWNYRRGTDHTDCVLSPASVYKNCRAVRSYDVGLVQINSGWRTLTARVCKRPARQLIRSLTDPSCNLKVASVLWDGGKGASNWGTRSSR